jgi:hypothetical protein
MYARDAQARAQLLDAAASSAAIAHGVWPALLSVLRAKPLVETATHICRDAMRAKVSDPAVVYALMSLLLGPVDALRAPAVQALVSPQYALDLPGISLAVSLSAKSAVRGPTDRERGALEHWTAAGAPDPLAGRNGNEVWSLWITGREMPECLDYALVLATAGAQKAAVEQLRSVSEHLCNLWGRASPQVGMLWRWLALGGPDGEANTTSGRATWASSGARVVALSAIGVLGITAALERASATYCDSQEFDRSVLEQLLRSCARDCLARKQTQSETLWWAQTEQLHVREAAERAVEQAVEVLCESLAKSSVPAEPLLKILLGIEARSTSKTAVVEHAWLSEAARIKVLSVALVNASLGARAAALRELETRGVPAVLLASLKEVAKSDADAVTRQHARQLARGEHL